MATLKITTETMKVSTGATKIPLVVRRPDSDSPATMVVICNPLPLAGEASHNLMEAIVDAVNEEGHAAATYEPACEGLILEDFDKYSAAESVAEIDAVLKFLTRRGESNRPTVSRVVLLGYGAGAIIASMVAATAGLAGLCLLNPLTPNDVTSMRSQSSLDPVDGRSIPAAFAASISSLDPFHALAIFPGSSLILSGPADRVARAESAEQFVVAARTGERRSMHLLIACGDHALTDAAARQAAIERIVHFSRGRA